MDAHVPARPLRIQPRTVPALRIARSTIGDSGAFHTRWSHGPLAGVGGRPRDGGLLPYTLGLQDSPLCRGRAPVAGVLHLLVDALLPQGRGKDTRMLVIPGVPYSTFAVAFTRQTCDLLKSIGYNVTYEELPE